jgi:hypothetical protein
MGNELLKYAVEKRNLALWLNAIFGRLKNEKFSVMFRGRQYKHAVTEMIYEVSGPTPQRAKTVSIKKANQLPFALRLLDTFKQLPM